MTPPPLLWEIASGIARIRFNRPERLNALDVPMAQAFYEAVVAITRDPTVRVVVLSGQGRAFMAGGDLAYLHAAPDRAEAARRLIGPVNAALVLLDRSGLPTISALRGAAAGAGMSLALSTDMAIASEDVRFNMAYLKVAAPPDCGGSWALTRLVGSRKAMHIALTCETIDAAEALDLGLVNEVVPATDLEARVTALAERIAAGPGLATRHTRDLINRTARAGLADHLAAEMDAFAACAATKDFAEALAAFFEKRPARFEAA